MICRGGYSCNMPEVVYGTKGAVMLLHIIHHLVERVLSVSPRPA